MERKKYENVDIPNDVKTRCGYTLTPNILFRKESGLGKMEILLILYLLSKPEGWVFYHERIARELKVSERSIYNLKRGLKGKVSFHCAGKGLYGTGGFTVRFDQLWDYLLSIQLLSDEDYANSAVGNEQNAKYSANLALKSEENADYLLNTNKKQLPNYKKEGFYSEKKLYDRNNDLSSPTANNAVDDTGLSSGSEKEINESDIINDSKYEKLFSCYPMLSKNKKNECVCKLGQKPEEEIVLLLEYSDEFKYWCSNIAPDLGFNRIETPTVPLMLSEKVYPNFIQYIQETNEAKKLEQERHNEFIESRRKEIEMDEIKREYITNYPYDEKMRILKAFRFSQDQGGNYEKLRKKYKSIEDMANDTWDDIFQEYSRLKDMKYLHDILSQSRYFHPKDEYYWFDDDEERIKKYEEFEKELINSLRDEDDE